ncbi:TetR/AcrR family transcriptional regulator [Actinoplanes friuliensis]|uniref:TetR family transcriptional regulator n=1 Tax=Actinoplanes friuliensis DSM 7358 TaxID=1246995 RepID=U5VW57_9ACTN|nr:TetR/AcrR family transcriptional regulator [Actinoplanes friuliensis]AGZ41223.1 TetR family transcriptional regulator [Actinoplanes friuliensis DSM 7358]
MNLTETGRARNPRGEGARLRDEIVGAAVDLLDETGDERALTLRSIARRAGIAAPSIYRHFPDQPAIMLAVVRDAFAELHLALRAAVTGAGDDPRERLLALCHAYLHFAQSRPQRYRTMFGGLWTPTPGESSIVAEDLTSLGNESLALLAEALDACVATGTSLSTDPAGDAVAVWLGLHGFAHQRAVSHRLPGPADLGERMITALARLTQR